jgi:high-affinity iron transporter
MLGQYLIAFRETLEAALITAIILSYLARSGRSGLMHYVLYGIVLALAASLSLGVIIWLTYGLLPEASKLLFEALTALAAVFVLSSMIYWMAIRGRYIREEMERRVEAVTSLSTKVSLISLSFIVSFREGFETVLFITPFLLIDTVATLVGSLLGFLTAALLSYGLFVLGMKINLRMFFYLTSIMLILLAGGLAGYGTHELLEYLEQIGFKLGWLAEPAYTLNIPADSPLHHKGLIGSVFAVMFGYTISAEWARIIVHISYLSVMLPLVVWVYREIEGKNFTKA